MGPLTGPLRAAPKGLPDLIVSPSDDIFGAIAPPRRRPQEWILRKLQTPGLDRREVDRLTNQLLRTRGVCREGLGDYRAAIEALAGFGRWRGALACLKDAMGRGVQGAVQLCAGLIPGCAQVGMWQEALALVDAMDSGGEEAVGSADLAAITGASRKSADLAAVVGTCARNKKWQLALTIWDEVEEAGSSGLDAKSYASAVRACREGLLWERALSLLQDSRKQSLLPEPRSASLHHGVVTILTKAQKWELALFLSEELLQQGLVSNTEAFEARLTALGGGGLWREALDIIFVQMPREDAVLTPFTYNEAIRACAASGRWEEAIDLLHTMFMQKVSPTSHCYGSAIKACRKAAAADQALELLREMERREVSPGFAHYDGVIRACDGASHQEKDRARERGDEDDHGAAAAGIAPELLREMKEREIIPNEGTYFNVIRAHELAQQADPAVELLTEMKQRQVPRSAHVYCSVASTLGRAGRWERALGMLDEMRADKIAPTNFNYDTAITAAALRAKWRVALQLFSEILPSLDSRNVHLHTSTTIACARNGQWQWALWLLEQKLHTDSLPGPYQLSAALYACRTGQEWRWALWLLKGMPELAIMPHWRNYRDVISACDRAEAWEWAVELLGEIKSQGRSSMSSLLYGAVVSACDRGHQWTRVLELLEEMREGSYEPDLITYSLCVGAARKRGLALVDAAEKSSLSSRQRRRPQKRRVL